MNKSIYMYCVGAVPNVVDMTTVLNDRMILEYLQHLVHSHYMLNLASRYLGEKGNVFFSNFGLLANSYTLQC